MWRVIGVILIWPMLGYSQQGQYEDTIRGKLTVNYNNPMRMKLSLLAGGAFEIQGLEGGVMLPSFFADLHIRPSKWVSFHCGVTNQFQLGWQYQKIQDTRGMEAGARLFLGRRTIDKIKTFTAGAGAWNYDFHFPVKVLWNLGITGNYRLGRGAFNSGLDPNTSVRFRNLETNKIQFLEQVAIPYSYGELSGGFVLNTSSGMKVTAHLPYGQNKARRMKTFTEVRAEFVYGTRFSTATAISVRASDDAINPDRYAVIVNKTSRMGYRIVGEFRRRWVGFKIEAGMRPGIDYHFSGGTSNGPFNRSYLLLGMGFGWMQ